MLIEDLITRSPVTIEPQAPVPEAARLMRERDVGSVVVVEGGRIVGILTDRDIAMGLALGVGARAPVRDLMTPNPVCLPAGHDVEACLERMGAIGVRRMPVQNERGELIGVVSLDDILIHLGHLLGRAASLIRSEVIGSVRGAS